MSRGRKSVGNFICGIKILALNKIFQHCLEGDVDGMNATQCNHIRASLISAFSSSTSRGRAQQLCAPANITPHMWTEGQKLAAQKNFKMRETEVIFKKWKGPKF